MIKKQQVFITGASSVLLTEVINLIDFAKFEVIGLTRSASSPLPQGLVRCVGDLLDPDTYRVHARSSDIIIHGAALTHSQTPHPYIEVNVGGTTELLNQIPTNRAPLFVFISSRVAGEKSGAYGESKQEAETSVRQSAKNWLILRPSEVFGGSKNEGVDGTIQSALGGGIIPCPIGVQSKMYPIHVKDVAKSIYQSVFENGEQGLVKHVNGRTGYTYKELLQSVESATGKVIVPFPIPKIVMKLAAIVSSTLNISVGFVPDQVERLYSKKEHDSDVDYQTISLEEYLMGLVSE